MSRCTSCRVANLPLHGYSCQVPSHIKLIFNTKKLRAQHWTESNTDRLPQRSEALADISVGKDYLSVCLHEPFI